MLQIVVLFVLFALPVIGCNSSGSAPVPPPVAAAVPPPAPAPAPLPAAAPPSDRIEDVGFELTATPTGAYSATKLASFAVTLKPRGIYHVNQEYPVALSVHPTSGLSFPKAELAKGDLAEMGEKVARFDVPFTAEKAGTYHVEAHLRFAVCTPDNCVPDERTLALQLSVQ